MLLDFQLMDNLHPDEKHKSVTLINELGDWLQIDYPIHTNDNC